MIRRTTSSKKTNIDQGENFAPRGYNIGQEGRGGNYKLLIGPLILQFWSGYNFRRRQIYKKGLAPIFAN